MTYTVRYLLEMARSLGDSSFSRIENNKGDHRSKYFNHSKDRTVNNKLNDRLHIQSNREDGKTTYATNDHIAKETLHVAHFLAHKATSIFPFKHETQEAVDRVKSTDVLPKGHAMNVAYNHFKHSDIPLRTSSEQFKKGHEMWHRLVDRALADGHHVYHYDGSALHKTTEANKKEHLQNSFGGNPNAHHDIEGDKFEQRHMILSKHELK